MSPTRPNRPGPSRFTGAADLRALLGRVLVVLGLAARPRAGGRSAAAPRPRRGGTPAWRRSRRRTSVLASLQRGSATVRNRWVPSLRASLRRLAVATGFAGGSGRRRPRPAPRPAAGGFTAVPAATRPRGATVAAPVSPPAPGHVAGRLLAITAGTVVGLFVLFGVGQVLLRPALSSAAEVVAVRLDIPDDASLPALEERSVMYDNKGDLLAVFDREVSRRTVGLRAVPEHVQGAVVAAEDRKFYEHDGYDIEGIGRAFVANVRAGQIEEGGSTITQQLAKAEVGDQRSYERKVTELLYAVALEERFTKDELLERYLNMVYFGSRAYGIAAAAEEFFGTVPRKLTPDQGALLASLIRSPNSADPRDKPELAMERRNRVLDAMAELGYVEPERLEKLKARPLGVKDKSVKRKKRQPHVVDAVERELLSKKAFGKTREERERLLYYGGLRIYTTLDTPMQRAAKEAIDTYVGDAPTAAVATVDPQTGAIRVLQSGLSYKDLEYDLPSQGRRQPGSAMKPFVYAEALQQGFPPEMTLDGKSPAYFDGVRDWERDCGDDDPSDCGVTNYGLKSFGRLDMASALKNSVNTAAAQLTITIGHRNVAKRMKKMGINIDRAIGDDYGPGIGLGGLTHGATPLEMAAAYAVFANEGKRIRPHLIERVEDRTGKVLYTASRKSKQVLDPTVNGVMVDMMRGVVTGGTGTGAALPSWPVAGKTGTTSNNVDAWFVGYTPVLSTAVWVGHAEGQVEMSGMTGGSTPASIWRTYMAKVLEGRKVREFPSVDPDDLAERVGSKEVTVPDVVRMTETEALKTLGKRKLVAEVREQASYAPAGTVIWQSPRPGATALPGDTIYVGVSTGKAPVTKPRSGGSSPGGDDSDEDEDAAEEEPPPEEQPAGDPPPEEGGGETDGESDGTGNGKDKKKDDG